MSIQVQNLKLLPNIPFEEYLALPGHSHSSIRSNGKEIKPATPKMLLGKDVDAYLTDPLSYEYDNVEIVRPIANEVIKVLGKARQYLKPQLAFTCDFVFSGFRLPYKGRADLAIIRHIVIDVKVSEMPLKRFIEYFRADNQVSGYALAIGAKAALIIQAHPKTYATSVYNVPIVLDWWEQQIIQKGEPII